MSDLLEAHFIELPKFTQEKPRQLRTPFERWLYILKFGSRYDAKTALPRELHQEEGVDMAIAELQKLNSNREMRQLIEAREKARHDEATRFAEAELRGKLAKMREIAEKLLAEGIPIAKVADLTGLSEAEVRDIASAPASSRRSRVQETTKPYGRPKRRA